MLTRETVIQEILNKKLIAIIRGAREEQALAAVRALADGGVSLVELTFNQTKPETFAGTANAIRNIRDCLGDRVTVGAGTVISVEQVELAAQAGASYIISPDTDEAVIRRTRELGLVSLPGAYTPTEAKQAHNAGADFVKLFPCLDGPEYLKAILAPLSHIRFLAVGGITAENAKAFLQAGAAGLGVGGGLVNKKLLDAGDYIRIKENARRFIRCMQEDV